jgi:hypothetical protein
MPNASNSEPIHSAWDSEVQYLLWLATCASVFSFLYFFQRGDVMLYGDAVAHINIARRVFDSKTPGLLQLGTVWLPLPHLLMIPFLISHEMWRSGIGGSIPSLAAYVLGVVGIFRLIRGSVSRTTQPDGSARAAAWTAALVYAANPNLLYMQATAMGESVYLAFFIWAVTYFAEALRGDRKACVKCSLCLAAGCLTRYDGWLLSAAITTVVLVSQFWPAVAKLLFPRFPRAAVVKFALISAAAPALWFAYNGIVYRNPLEFENGPYSAKAIEGRSQTAGNPGHPGSGNLFLAGMYFMKSAEINLAQNDWLERIWILIATGAAIVVALSGRLAQPGPTLERSWPLLFLLLPIPFYASSIAYAGVPLFIPPWWPFTHYNVRYGLELLPAFAAAIAILASFVLRFNRWNFRRRLACLLAILAFGIASYASIWRATPACLEEAQSNMRTRNQLEAQLAHWFEQLPPDSTLLMYLGDHVGALERAGIPLQRVINEGNHRVWKQPADPEGLWERALAKPAQYADYVIAFDGDPVWQAVAKNRPRALVEIHVSGQPRAILFQAR